MKVRAKILDLWLVKLFVKSFWFNWPKGYFNFWWLLWIHIKILVKRSCLWKMELGFRTYVFVSLLGQIDSKQIIRPKASKWRHIITFDKFIGFISKLWLKWGLICEKQNSGSGLMAFLRLFCNFDPNCSKLVFRHQKLGLPVLGSSFFFFKFYKILHENEFLFSKFGWFLAKLWGFHLRKLQKSIKKRLF